MVDEGKGVRGKEGKGFDMISAYTGRLSLSEDV
jgi:hypothetical protein